MLHVVSITFEVTENDGVMLRKKQWCFTADVPTIVYSLISGPQTFSDFFYIMKVCEETVLCS